MTPIHLLPAQPFDDDLSEEDEAPDKQREPIIYLPNQPIEPGTAPSCITFRCTPRVGSFARSRSQTRRSTPIGCHPLGMGYSASSAGYSASSAGYAALPWHSDGDWQRSFWTSEEWVIWRKEWWGWQEWTPEEWGAWRKSWCGWKHYGANHTPPGGTGASTDVANNTDASATATPEQTPEQPELQVQPSDNTATTTMSPQQPQLKAHANDNTATPPQPRRRAPTNDDNNDHDDADDADDQTQETTSATTTTTTQPRSIVELWRTW